MTTIALDEAAPARLLLRPTLADCLTALATPGEETRLVGGCVRDALLGHAVADIDLATTLRPARTMALAREAGIKAVPTGFDHGTVTLVVDGEAVEVTTLREDIETDGRRAVVRFGRDFARDAERRDFTINALSLGSDSGLHDTTGGLADLRAGRVRFIGDAQTRIREDALRILRFFRFHARYGVGAPDPEGLAAAIRARDLIDTLSRERVHAEFVKLLIASRALEAIAVLSESGLLARITGGVAELGRLERAIAAERPAIARLAALSVQSTEDAERLSGRLRLSKAEIVRLAGYADAVAALKSQREISAAAMRALFATQRPESLRDALAATGREPHSFLSVEARTVVDTLAAPPVFPLKGADLVALGIAPGQAVGRGLAAAKALWLAEGCPSDKTSRRRLLDEARAAANDKPAGAS